MDRTAETQAQFYLKSESGYSKISVLSERRIYNTLVYPPDIRKATRKWLLNIHRNLTETRNPRKIKENSIYVDIAQLDRALAS